MKTIMDAIHYHQSLNDMIKKHLPKDYYKHKFLTRFLWSMNELCFAFENEKEQLKGQIRPSERKYAEINTKLKEEIEQRRESVHKLMEGISKLDLPKNYQLPDFGEDNLFELAIFIKKLLIYQQGIEIQLRKAKEDADKASNAKSEFLSMMSHEIRTPLNGIVAMTYLMQQGTHDPEMTENLKILNFSTENLYVLINDILDFNKIEAGKVALEMIEFNLKDLVTNIKKSVQINVSTKKLNLILNYDERIPEFVMGDPLRLSQILNNLVNNAVKFTEEGYIIIDLTLNQINEEKVSIDFSIKDSGIGIAKEHIPFIFEKFRQADNQISRRFGGTGLGLGITKKLLELHGSNIQVESETDIGSKFYFTLEMKIASQDGEILRKEEDLDEQILRGTRILLVEDFPMNVKIATRFLEKWGMKYDTASNGRIAVEKLLHNNYQIVLMDLLMPEMDGYTATENIRKFDKKTPIIALTASALNTQSRVYEVGMNDFVTKPFNPKELFQKINKHALRA
ncbi:Sensor histidine kinase RcsC [Emticicia aquatica]|uniref:histidine kinase n=1 Tax=Emticicia aquatica TaxID=1681835 RepID=A0ABN8EQ78_9BACT|nr:response regulator [Emticicia aquatica]CAH0995065.1 Sensor histidine kinase RcsC [Emticicia aquatica]